VYAKISLVQLYLCLEVSTRGEMFSKRVVFLQVAIDIFQLCKNAMKLSGNDFIPPICQCLVLHNVAIILYVSFL